MARTHLQQQNFPNRRAAAAFAGLSVALLFACGGSTSGTPNVGTPVAPREVAAVRRGPATNPSDAGWAVRRLGALPLALELPEAPAWQALREAPR